MYVSMYVCVYATRFLRTPYYICCIYVSIYLMDLCSYVSMHRCMYVPIYPSTYLCGFMYPVPIYLCVCVCIYVYLYISLRISIYISIYLSMSMIHLHCISPSCMVVGPYSLISHFPICTILSRARGRQKSKWRHSKGGCLYQVLVI